MRTAITVGGGRKSFILYNMNTMKLFIAKCGYVYTAGEIKTLQNPTN